jgi:hypothetical protein
MDWKLVVLLTILGMQVAYLLGLELGDWLYKRDVKKRQARILALVNERVEGRNRVHLRD